MADAFAILAIKKWVVRAVIMQKQLLGMIGVVGGIIGFLALVLLVVALMVHEVGNPILILISSLLVAQNTWAFRNGKSMYFGIGASAPDAGSVPRAIKLIGVWVLFIGFLLEQAYSLMQALRLFA